jgi:hypothetical protein
MSEGSEHSKNGVLKGASAPGLFFLLTLGLLLNCGGADRRKETLGEASKDIVTSQQPIPVSARKTSALALLTPDQISNRFFESLGYRYERVVKGTKQNLITTTLAVPLGGVDFDSVSEYDPNPKVQNLMIVRLLAWNAAKDIVARESKGAPQIFTKCDLKKDKPGTERWRAQVDDLYWRLYSRGPREAEWANLEKLFSSIHANEPSLPQTWTLFLYALLSTAEFWLI